MKVTLFSTEHIVHGRRYLHLLRLSGCEVVFVEDRKVAHLNEPGVRYERYPRRFGRIGKFIGKTPARFVHEWLLKRLWRSEKPDICHIQWIDDRLWHCGRARLRPLVATAWGSDVNVPAAAGADNPAHRIVSDALRMLDLLIVDSNDVAEAAMRLAGKEIRTLLLPMGINTDQFAPNMRDERGVWRNKLGIKPTALVLLSPRQLGANYRQTDIIRAFAALGLEFRKNMNSGSTHVRTQYRDLSGRSSAISEISWGCRLGEVGRRGAIFGPPWSLRRS